MSQKKQPYTQVRAVCYPCIIAGQAVDRIGFFEVDFHSDDLPLRARMLRFVGYETPAQMVEFLEDIERAMYELPTLICRNDPVDFDNDEWEGILFFPRRPILH